MPSTSTSYDSVRMRVSGSDLFVIRLDASVELRVAGRDRRRPPMRAAGPRATMGKVMRIRDPLYVRPSASS